VLVGLAGKKDMHQIKELKYIQATCEISII